jgi:hypothetical protein
MGARDWMKERDFVLGAAMDFMMRWGGDVKVTAAEAVRLYYRGISPERATALLARDLNVMVEAQKRRMFEKKSRELVTMAHALESEGWRWMTIPDRPGGFFWHDQYGSVNNMGGGFPTWDEAVCRTFNSAIRQMVTA